MYCYLLLGAVVVFGVWIQLPLEEFSSVDMSFSNKPLWKCIGKVILFAAMVLTVVAVMSSYAARYSKSGLAAYNQGHYAVAETNLRLATNFYPSDISTHYYLALSLLHEGKKADALAEFRSVSSQSQGRYTGDTDRQLGQEAQDQIEKLSGEP